MPITFKNKEYADMHFVPTFCNRNCGTAAPMKPRQCHTCHRVAHQNASQSIHKVLSETDYFQGTNAEHKTPKVCRRHVLEAVLPSTLLFCFSIIRDSAQWQLLCIWPMKKINSYTRNLHQPPTIFCICAITGYKFCLTFGAQLKFNL